MLILKPIYDATIGAISNTIIIPTSNGIVDIITKEDGTKEYHLVRDVTITEFAEVTSWVYNAPIKLYTGDLFNGHGYTIDMEAITEWYGLFDLSESNSPEKLVNIKNIKIINAGKLKKEAGCIVQGYISASSKPKNMYISNCWVNDLETINNKNQSLNLGTAGIVGSFANGLIIIENCNVTGVIGHSGGGIIGQKCFGDITISNCSFTGELHYSSGGIAGRQLGGPDADNQETDHNSKIKISTL